jgi:SAM-dependent MidA family methyltransferase
MPESEIRRLIAERGRVTFEEFMRAALYGPGGYYTTTRPVGTSGDYFTSPVTHPAFGTLITLQLHSMWQVLGEPEEFTAIEPGAGSGVLAATVAEAAALIDESFSRCLRYVAVDRSLAGEDGDGLARRFQRVLSDSLPFHDVTGCILSNELLDALPVHRFQIVGRKLREVYVTLDANGDFVEMLDAPLCEAVSRRVEPYLATLPDGYRGEVNPHIDGWTGEAANALRRGFLLTIDYGHLTADLYSPSREFGTFDTYYRHTRGSSPYQRIGRQDMTAHADFGELEAAGERHGLRKVFFDTQAAYLTALGLGRFVERTGKSAASRSERAAARLAMLELVKPQGLGGFRVMIQERNTGIGSSADLFPGFDAADRLPVPRLSARHMPPAQDRYPNHTFEMNAFWPPTDSPPEQG